MAPAIPEIVWFAILFFSFAVVYTLRKFIEAMLGTLISVLGHVPLIGGYLTSLLQSTEQAVAHALGAAENGIDAAIGGSFHYLANLTDRLWNDFKSHATLIAELAADVLPVTLAIHALRALVHSLEKGRTGISAAVKTLTKEYHGIDKRVRTLERDISKGIGHDLRIQVKALEKEVAHVENVVVPGIRSIANTAENDVTDLQRWITDHFPAVGTEAFAGAVAVALAALGLGGMSCNSNPFKNNRNACSLWSRLSSLLGLAAFLTIAFDFQEFVDASEQVAQFIGTAVGEFEGAFPVSLEPLPPPQG